MLYALITEYGLDQVCESREDMIRERKDLRAMGCNVKTRTFADWASLNAATDRGEFDV
jgi:ABC-type metal ion transport system substrate-binding protein